MTTLQPFIDRGYYTVPLNGSHIKRNSQGKKHGYSFPADWYSTYSKSPNQVATPIGATLVGHRSNIVAIDCDNKASYDLFRQLDPDNQAFFTSIGKLTPNGDLIECGTILYQFDQSLPPSKKIKTKVHELDWFSTTGCVFLPTTANATKSTWTEDAEGNLHNQDNQPVIIRPMPITVKQVLELILQPEQQQKTVSDTQTAQRSKGFLGKILASYDLTDLTDTATYEPAITKLLTPREYRTALYHKQGHLHPNDVPARHDYQFKVMCQLAGDNTVDATLARDLIYYLNSLWDSPRPAKQLESEIIGGIISGKQKNQAGEPYWQYDENWETLANWSGITKLGNYLVEVFYDPFKSTHFVYNTHTESLMEKVRATDMIAHIRSSCVGTFNQAEAISDMANVETLVQPTEDFGYLDNDTKFNLFKPTQALRIMADPSTHKEDYTRPTEFIEYMEHFIPDPTQRQYLLSLMKRKLTTFDYSPVVPYLIGVPGSGKGLLMSIIANIMGEQYVAKEVTGSQFINQFNKGWLEDKYFVNLNELAEGLANRSERIQATGRLKVYTGATTFQCQGKGKDYYTTDMHAMFIMTANFNPLEIEDNDRRIYYISTPNTFKSSSQCVEAGDFTKIAKIILNQTLDIAYWLATEVKDISNNDYGTAPMTAGKEKIIEQTLDAMGKVVLYCNSENWEKLSEHLIANNGTTRFLDKAKKGVLMIGDLADDCQAMLDETVDSHTKDSERPIVNNLLQLIEHRREVDAKGKAKRGRRRWSDDRNCYSYALKSLRGIHIEVLASREPIDVSQLEEEIRI